MTSVGFDFGNQFCVIGAESSGHVDIVSNDQSNRLTPSMVTYTNSRRYAGEESLHHQLEFFDCTFSNLKQIIGMKYDSYDRIEFEKQNFFKLERLDDGLTGIKISSNDSEMLLRPEQCIGYLFLDVFKQISKKIPNIRNIALDVPQSWNETKRRLLMVAARMMKKEVTLVNSNTAVAVAYASQHFLKLDPEKPRIVMFIDIGYSGMNVTISKIKRYNVEIISYASDSCLGGSHYNTPFVQYLIQKVKDKYKIDPTQSRRGMYRFLQAAEKVKKNLSVNQAVQFEVDSIMNIDISFIVKREEFNNAVKPLLDILTMPIQECISNAKIDKQKIDVVELLGGGSRVFAVKQRISEFLGKKLSTTLNLDECFATGCGHYAAISVMRIPRIQIRDIIPFEIVAKWKENNEEKSIILFKKFAPLLNYKSFHVVAYGQTDINVFSNNEIIGTLHINYDNNQKPLRIVVDANVNPSFIINLSTHGYKNYTYTLPINITPSDEKEYQDLEEKMGLLDIKEREIDDEKNNLEASLYLFENSIEGEYKKFLSSDELEEYRSLLLKIQLWFEANEFDRHPKEVYIEQRKSIEDMMQKARKIRLSKGNFI